MESYHTWSPLFCFAHVLNRVQLFVTPRIVSLQTLSMEFSRQEILKWVVTSSSSESSWPRYWTRVSRIGRRILYHCATWEAPVSFTVKLFFSFSLSFHVSSQAMCRKQVTPSKFYLEISLVDSLSSTKTFLIFCITSRDSVAKLSGKGPPFLSVLCVLQQFSLGPLGFSLHSHWSSLKAFALRLLRPLLGSFKTSATHFGRLLWQHPHLAVLLCTAAQWITPDWVL